MSKVSVVKCRDYDYENVKAAVRESVGLLGGISAFVKPGDRVLLKANLVLKRRPEKATTTHPSIVRALAEMVIEAGGKPVIGDSPGGTNYYNREVLQGIYETTGMREAAELSGAELNYNFDVIDVPYPQGKVIKNIKTIKAVIDADVIINIPKIKSHMMNAFSGAVKNMFGIIPGRYKVDYHFRFEDPADFADLLIDVITYATPHLSVMDAVVGMEGYGPTNGSPKQVGLILSSADPYSLDAVAAYAIGIDPPQIPMIRKSVERGLYDGKFDRIDIVGERIRTVRVLNFKKPTVRVAFNIYSWVIPKPLLKRFNRYIKPSPSFNHAQCRKCRACFESCPPQAITLVEGKPVVDLQKCIRCFCCDELCVYAAVEIKKPWFLRAVIK
jgi:uncharacterized protein (DUF362 family)/Pyruvate/2-oxoacid:ferredoxin oxidoreductase delta subunit